MSFFNTFGIANQISQKCNLCNNDLILGNNGKCKTCTLSNLFKWWTLRLGLSKERQMVKNVWNLSTFVALQNIRIADAEIVGLGVISNCKYCNFLYLKLS